MHFFIEFMKNSASYLTLNLSHNRISDIALDNIEKYILFASNPPIQEIDFSFNKFSRKVTWRLSVGHIHNLPSHPYLNFIIYPIPFHPDIFLQSEVDFPRPNPKLNVNLHSALIE